MRTRESLPFGHPGCPVTGKRAGTFIDTGKDLKIVNPNGVGWKRWDFCVSEAGALLLGRHIGMLDRADAAELKAEVITLKHRVSQLEDELSDADAFIDGTEALARKGLQIRRPPGRPKKPTKED